MPEKSITAVLNCHREREILRPSFRSVVESLREFDSTGDGWELLCIADRSDEETLQVLKEELSRWHIQPWDLRIIHADFGDLALSRNLAVERAHGKFIGFVDADDLVSRNWFACAHQYGRRFSNCIWHPEYSLYFGAMKAFWVHRDQRFYDLWALFFHNLWTALSFAPAKLYRLTPYQPNQIDRGFGYEDWHWNSETIARGHEHRMVPGTSHFIRLKPASLSQQTLENQCLIRPTGLWRLLPTLGVQRHETVEHLPMRSTVADWLYRFREGLSHSGERKPGYPEDPSDGELSAKLFRDPHDVSIDALPSWVHWQLSAAAAHEPLMDLSGQLVNFSPILHNPFVPHFPRRAMEALAGAVDTIYFVKSAAELAGLNLTARDLALVQDGPAPGPRSVPLAGLDSALSSKYDLFLAMFIIQSGCRRLCILTNAGSLPFLQKYRRALASVLQEDLR